jgi:hypothetical protein
VFTAGEDHVREAVAAWPRLRHFMYVGRDFCYWRTLKALVNCPDLRTLAVPALMGNPWKTKDKIAQYLAVVLPACAKIEVLDMSCSSVSDEALSVIAHNSPRLRLLSLASTELLRPSEGDDPWTPMSVDGLEAVLTGCPNLTHVELAGSELLASLTEESIATLRAKHPRFERVWHDAECAVPLPEEDPRDTDYVPPADDSGDVWEELIDDATPDDGSVDTDGSLDSDSDAGTSAEPLAGRTASWNWTSLFRAPISW